MLKRVISALRRFGPESFRPGSFWPGSFQPSLVGRFGLFLAHMSQSLIGELIVRGLSEKFVDTLTTTKQE